MYRRDEEHTLALVQHYAKIQDTCWTGCGGRPRHLRKGVRQPGLYCDPCARELAYKESCRPKHSRPCAGGRWHTLPTARG